MDWIAGIFEIIGKWIVGRKCKWGWLFHLVGGAMWTIIAFRTGLYGLLIITIPAFFLNIYNFFKWQKQEKK